MIRLINDVKASISYVTSNKFSETKLESNFMV